MGVKQWSFVLRLPSGLREHLKRMAEDQDRSVNSLVVHILKREVINFRKERGEKQPDLFEHSNDAEK